MFNIIVTFASSEFITNIELYFGKIINTAMLYNILPQLKHENSFDPFPFLASKKINSSLIKFISSTL